MEQATEIADFVEMLHAASGDLSIGLFSGYAERELNQGRYANSPENCAEERRDLWRRIRSHLDFAVLGRFNQLQPAFDPLVSSQNQRLRLLSHRYTIDDFEPQSIEMTIDDSGLTQITGFPVLGPLSRSAIR